MKNKLGGGRGDKTSELVSALFLIPLQPRPVRLLQYDVLSAVFRQDIQKEWHNMKFVSIVVNRQLRQQPFCQVSCCSFYIFSFSLLLAFLGGERGVCLFFFSCFKSYLTRVSMLANVKTWQQETHVLVIYLVYCRLTETQNYLQFCHPSLIPAPHLDSSGSLCFQF